MLATVTLTGTGVPFPQPGRAGPGALVRRGDIALQIDITHVHSDHAADLPDIAMTRWLRGGTYSAGPLIVVAPQGGAGDFVKSMLDPCAADIAVRTKQVQPAPPEVVLRPFPPPDRPEVIWRGGEITGAAVRVHHEPCRRSGRPW